MPLFGVSHDKYDKLVASNSRLRVDFVTTAEKYARLLKSYTQLLTSYNRLVETINSKGGDKFLNNAVMPDKVQAQLSAEDVKRLIQLCHPDKHGGKPAAVEMTRKLLALRT